MADDKVFRVVDMYHNGIWDRDRALKEIKVYQTYDQIAFITQKAIDKLLKFDSKVNILLTVVFPTYLHMHVSYI